MKKGKIILTLVLKEINMNATFIKTTEPVFTWKSHYDRNQEMELALTLTLNSDGS